MTTEALIEQLDLIQQQRAIAAHRRFSGLAQSAAADQHVDANDLADALNAAGKTAADFRAAVEKTKKRASLRVQIAALPGLEARKRENDETLSRLATEFEEVRKSHLAKTEPLAQAQRQIESAIVNARYAQDELLSLAEGEPEFAEREQALRQRRSNLADEQRAIEKQLDGREPNTPGSTYLYWFPSRIREAEAVNAKAIPKLQADRVEYHERKIKPLEDRLARVKSEFAELVKDEEALRAEKCSI